MGLSLRLNLKRRAATLIGAFSIIPAFKEGWPGLPRSLRRLGNCRFHFGNSVMTFLCVPFQRDDMFHVEQFALSAHFLQKIEA